MSESVQWYIKTEDGKVYGPADEAKLVGWAEDGRIDPTSYVSEDRISWVPAQKMEVLRMNWLIETEPGKVFGPFNRAVAIRLFQKGEVGESAKAYRLHEYPIDEDAPPVEKIVEKEVRVEVPVERIVDKIVEVEPPARTEQVVAEVVEPVAEMPPVRSPGAIFGNLGRRSLAALESAARKELSAAGRRNVKWLKG